MNNPLSPHLQIYKWQITSVLSILHRITGVLLSVGTVLLTLWLLALSLGESYFNYFSWIFSTFLGRTVLIGFTWAVCFHMMNGIRHIVWDLGYGMKINTVKITGWLVITFSFILTTIIWLLVNI